MEGLPRVNSSIVPSALLSVVRPRHMPMPPSSLTDWRWRLPLSLSPGDLRLWPQPTEAGTVQPQNNLADLTALLLLVVRHTGGPSKQIKMYEQDIFVGDVEFSWKFRQIVRKKESRVELSAKIMFTTDMPGIPDVSLT